jgi:hypothetical protein
VKPKIFIAVFVRARHSSLSWATRLHPIQLHLISLSSLLLPFLHLWLHLLYGFFFLDFPVENLHEFLCSRGCYISCQSHPPWLGRVSYILGRVHATKLLSLLFRPTSYYFFLLQSKYSPQYHGPKCLRLSLYIRRKRKFEVGYNKVNRWALLFIRIYSKCVLARLTTRKFWAAHLKVSLLIISTTLLSI